MVDSHNWNCKARRDTQTTPVGSVWFRVVERFFIEKDELPRLEGELNSLFRIEKTWIRLFVKPLPIRLYMWHRLLVGAGDNLKARVFDRYVVNSDPRCNIDYWFYRPVVKVLVPWDFFSAGHLVPHRARPQYKVWS